MTAIADLLPAGLGRNPSGMAQYVCSSCHYGLYHYSTRTLAVVLPVLIVVSASTGSSEFDGAFAWAAEMKYSAGRLEEYLQYVVSSL